MSKKYVEGVKVIKKPFKRIKKILLIFLLVVTIGGVYMLADYCSGALTLSNIVFSLGSSDKISKDKFSLYGVVMGTYDTYSEAERVGLGLQIQGGAGFVWQGNSKYLVLGSIYKTKLDANKVIDNLKESAYNEQVYEIKFPKINIHIKGLTEEDKELIENVLDYIEKVYDEVYGYSTNFDSSTITNLQISSYINSLLSESKVYISAMQEMYLRVGSEYVNILKECLIQVETSLDAGMYRALTNSGLNYYLKYLMCDIVQIWHEMYVDVSKV